MKILMLFITLVCALACRPDADGSRFSSLQGGAFGAILGQGFDIEEGAPTGTRCVRFSEDQIDTVSPEGDATPLEEDRRGRRHGMFGTTEGEIFFDRNVDVSEMRDLLGLSLSVTIPIYPGLSVKGTSDFASENAAQSYTDNVVFSYRVLNGSRRFSPQQLETMTLDDEVLKRITGRDDYDYPFDPPEIKTPCGTEMISQIDYGASFIAVMSINFRNQFESQKFGAELTVLLNMFGLNIPIGGGKFSKFDSQLREDIKVKVSAIQIGGDPKAMTGAIPFATGIQLEQPFVDSVECSFADMGPCVNIFGRLAQYGQNQFPEQLKDPANLVPMQYLTHDYSMTGYQELTPPSAQAINQTAAQLRRLTIRSTSEKSLLAKARALRESRASSFASPAIQEQDIERLGEAIEDLESNMRTYSAAFRFCRRFPGVHCDKALQEDFLPALHQVDESRVVITSPNFELWCRLYLQQKADPKNNFLNPNEYNTVGVLVERIRSKLNLAENCSELGPGSATMDELDLSHANIVDLAPLASLTNIRTLNLSSTFISDISPLFYFESLVNLDLSDTHFTKLQQIMDGGFPDLRNLTIRHNQISDRHLLSDPFWNSIHVFGD